MEFVLSDRNIGIQCADILAGTVMRYFRDTANGTAITPAIEVVMRTMLAGQELRTGFGINQVVPSRMVLTGATSVDFLIGPDRDKGSYDFEPNI